MTYATHPEPEIFLGLHISSDLQRSHVETIVSGLLQSS
jgi:hypothetical protein